MAQMIDQYTSLVNCFINIYTSGKGVFCSFFWGGGGGGRGLGRVEDLVRN